MAKLWQKNYELDSLLERFTTGMDYILDAKLTAADCISSIAHAEMLCSIGILSTEELSLLKGGLVEILKLDAKGEFIISPSDEDCHTAIENKLTEKLGEAGKKIHTGRSRNDQVLTALRVYSRSRLLDIAVSTLELAKSLVFMALKYSDVPMPGRTHMQIAMPSSVGLWAGAFAEELIDCVKLLEGVYRINNQSPLGSAASYGVPLPLDREMTAKLLAFEKVQNNVLYCNNSRGKFESVILDALDQITLTVSKMAQDLIIFSMPEFGYFHLPEKLCSGSSIMPQKKNPDGLELLRAKSSTVTSCAFQIKSIIRSLPTGYNRDFQETKEPFMRGLDCASDCIKIMELTIKNIEVDRAALEKGFIPEIYATDEALRLVAGGVSFRDAYKEVGLNIDKLKNRGHAPGDTITSRRYSGTAGKLNLEEAEKSIQSLELFAATESGKIANAVKALAGKVFKLS